MVGKDFNAQAAKKSGAHSVSDKQSSSVMETVKAQIEIDIEHETAMDSHHQDWKIQLNKLAHSPAPTMSPMGNDTPERDLQRQYTVMKDRWESERDAIDNQHSQKKQMAREAGTTLSNCFADSKDRQTTCIDRDNDSGRSR